MIIYSGAPLWQHIRRGSVRALWKKGEKNTNNSLTLWKAISSVCVAVSCEPGASEFSCDSFLLQNLCSISHRQGLGRASASNNVTVTLKPETIVPERFIAKFRSYMYTKLLPLTLTSAPCRVYWIPYTQEGTSVVEICKWFMSHLRDAAEPSTTSRLRSGGRVGEILSSSFASTL